MAGTDKTRDPILGGPAVVLVRPQLGENIGAAARAMLNFGLTEMRLVAPRDGWPNPQAEAMASGAAEILENAMLFDTLQEAIRDAHRVYATTARSREMIKPTVTPRRAAAEMRRDMEDGHRCALLFGAERAGLSNDEVAIADAIVAVPVNPAFASINLAQAVLLIAYEYFLAGDVTPDRVTQGEKIALPDKEAMFHLFEHLEAELDAGGFFRPAERRPHMVRSLRAMLTRAGFYDQDVRTLRGMIKALTKDRHRDKGD